MINNGINFPEGINKAEVYTGTNKKIELDLISYRIFNYKAFHDSGDILLKPLVMFYGNNSAGKTAIHQPLLLLIAAREQDRKSTNVNKSLVELEGNNCSIDDIRNHAYNQEKTSLIFNFFNNSNRNMDDEELLTASSHICYELSFSAYNDDFVEDGVISFKDTKYRVSDYYEFVNVFFLKEKTKEIPDGVKSLANGITDALRKFADELCYMGPVRKEAQREFVFSGKTPMSIGEDGVNAYEKLFSLINDSKVKNDEINRWISEFGYKLVWKPVERNRGRLMLKDVNTGLETNIVDNGFGIGQSLPVIVQMATMKNGTFLSDSPEAFLQANMQSKMADYVIGCVNRGNRLIVETGSEAFLYRVRRNISQGKISQDDVILYFIDSERAGDSKCIRINIDRKGYLSRQNNSFNRFFSGSFEDLSIMSMGINK